MRRGLRIARVHFRLSLIRPSLTSLSFSPARGVAVEIRHARFIAGWQLRSLVRDRALLLRSALPVLGIAAIADLTTPALFRIAPLVVLLAVFTPSASCLRRGCRVRAEERALGDSPVSSPAIVCGRMGAVLILAVVAAVVSAIIVRVARDVEAIQSTSVRPARVVVALVLIVAYVAWTLLRDQMEDRRMRRQRGEQNVCPR
jgi:hypothetical protein